MSSGVDPQVPVKYRITGKENETEDTFTLELKAESGSQEKNFHFEPGQFNMLYSFGTGEVPISISGDPDDSSRVIHTIRAVGTVTNALKRSRKGDSVGLRGPFGSNWPLALAEGKDVMLIAGGIGLAPLRPAIYSILANRSKYGQFSLLYGARSPKELLFNKEIHTWRSRFDADVFVTVDHALMGWQGNVGVVTQLIKRARFNPENTVVFICGPEIMMRFCLAELRNRGVAYDAIHVSMERNMKCALGFCGHCQFGPRFVCKDGPVFQYNHIHDLFITAEI